jgi:hypothetical protein
VNAPRRGTWKWETPTGRVVVGLEMVYDITNCAELFAESDQSGVIRVKFGKRVTQFDDFR